MDMNPMLLTDFYKLGHRAQYPEGTEKIYSTFTPRSSRIEGINQVVFFGLQGFIKEYLIDYFNQNFFNKPKEEILADYKRLVTFTLGGQYSEFNHISDLYDLGYLPIKINAVAEGTKVPIRTPMFTIENTISKFFWVTNFLETFMSACMWKPTTAATITDSYKRICLDWGQKTVDSLDYVGFQCHNFSMRGLSGFDDLLTNGMAQLTGFVGTDTIPAILYAEKYYNANVENELVGCSIPASEHSVQCTYGNDKQYFSDMINKTYPEGLVSIVSDGYDYWKMLTEVLPELKNDIMQRDGKVVIRPDCYSEDTSILTNRGWVFFNELTEGDLVAQVLDDGSYEFIKPLKYYKSKYKGDMIHYTDFHGKLDIIVTPNHRMIYNKYGKWIVQEAKDTPKFTSWDKKFLRSAKASSNGKQLTDMERLNIAFQADGSYQSSGNKIRFSFLKQRKIDRLSDILNRMGTDYKIYALSDGRSEFNINIHKDNVSKDFSWVDISQLDGEWCKEFVEELSYWDATIRNDNKVKFDTTNKDVIDILEYIVLSAGYGCYITEREDNRSELFSNVYTANILKNNSIGGQAHKKETIQYDGMVYCVQVPTGRLMVKRNKSTLVCGNSGDPVNIICGIEGSYANHYNKKPEEKGSIEILWSLFGGTINSKGYKVLDSHIGLIYGDAITPDRAKEIFRRLEVKGFSAENVVFGIGSYSLGYHTRDTFGMALKTTYAVVNGEEKLIFKNPKTDDGTKKSQKGMVAVLKDENDNLYFKDGLYQKDKDALIDVDLLKPVFENGKLLKETSLKEIRDRLI